jgi:abhydrolase domain-containing protein 8
VSIAAPLVELRPGRRLRVELSAPVGPPSGTTVVLVHGSGGRAEQWRDVLPGLLAAGHHVLRYDALGHGDSAAPRQWGAYAGRQYVEDLRAVVARHGGARNLLVGHSYGCSVILAALCAGLKPPIERAVLLGPPAHDLPRRSPWFAYLPVPLLERLRPKLSAGFRAAAWGPDAPAGLVAEETAITDRNSLYVFKAMFRQRLALEAQALAGLRLPITLLAGEADRLTPPDGAARLQAALPGATLQVLPRTGHQILLERPDAVLQAILAP